MRYALVVTYHCYRRVELQWSIRLDDELEQLQFTIALSLFWQADVRNSERCRDCDESERRKQSRAGEEKSSCDARLCSDPMLDGVFRPEFGRFPFLHNRHPSLLSLLSYLFCLLRHGRVTILRQRLNMAAPNSLQRMERSHYSPPWANTSIIGVAGSSGSGKTSLALAIIKQMSLPWVVILSMVRLSGP